MVLTALIIFILHEVKIPVQCVEGVFEEEGQEAISPGVCPEQVKDAETRTAVADPGQELELESGLAVKLALNVVLKHKLGQFGKLTTLKDNY